jgi:hypothetical protein
MEDGRERSEIWVMGERNRIEDRRGKKRERETNLVNQ